MNLELEIACFNLESLEIAQSAGATRVEFCVDYLAGGISPSRGQIQEARGGLSIPLHVIIRPRAGNFRYSQEEINSMLDLIMFCKQIGVNGVVLGILNEQNEVDVENCELLVKASKPMKVCFHRAIDECAEPEKEIKKLIQLDVDYVLSSGGEKNAELGAMRIGEWQKKFGDRINIIPGGSLRSENLQKVLDTTNCTVFHTSAITGSEHLPDKEEIKNLLRILKL